VTPLAHGVGSRQDLPIPFSFAVTGAALALVISFVALGLLWREPRLVPREEEGEARAPWVWRVLGLLLAAWFCVGLLFGPDTADNPTAGAFYVVFWVGLAFASLLLGPVWRALNPLRTVHLLASRALRRDPADGFAPYPERLGYWPATAGLFAFVWLELVAPERATLPVIQAWLLAYVGFTLVGAATFGSRWFDRGDPFEAYSDVVGRLSPLRGNPLDGIAGLRAAPGLVPLVVVLLGSTMYDSMSGSPQWIRFVQESTASAPVLGTLGLLGVIGIVLVAYLVATGLAGRLGKARGTPGELAHTIVPVAVGYVVAHYFSLFVLEGQRTLALASDPRDTGANWFGTANWGLSSAGLNPTMIATVQVTVIVLGHLVGTVLAHDRALVLFPRRTAVAGQVPLLALMVAYTVTGLLLLFAA